jgi:tRNA-dihydrouridine synthase B
MNEFAHRMSKTSSPGVRGEDLDRPCRPILRGRVAALPVFLAPMSGITDLPFRRLAARFGCDVVVTEMVASGELTTGGVDATVRLAGEGLGLHVVQIAGREPEPTARAAAMAVDAGADVIDLNMGCPSKRVCNGWSGSALMRDLDLAVALVRAVRAAVPERVPVTLKMRLGWSRAAMNAPELARRAVAEGVELVTVHGRTRDQFYEGVADWHAIRDVRAAVDVPLVVNGDIDGVASARAAMAASGADASMIGRAACGRPWLPGAVGRALRGEAAIEPPRGRARAELVIAHHEAMLSLHGRVIGLRAARKHLGWYLDAAVADDGLVVEEAARRALMTCEEPRGVVELVERIFSGEPERRAA